MSAPPAEAPEAPAAPSSNEPGSFDNLHAEVRGMLPLSGSVFEGARLFLSQPVGQHMNLQHQFHLGKEKSYHFAPTVVSTLNQISAQESYPIIMADMDNNGSLIAQIVHLAKPWWKFRFQAQTEGSKYLGVQAETEVTGKNWSSALKLINVDLVRGSGFLTLNYLQKITKNLDLGGEFMYQYGRTGEMGTSNFAGRYHTKEWTATASISPRGIVQASYYHQLFPKVSVGTDLDIDLRSMESQASVGIAYNFRRSSFRSQITSRGQVAGFLEKQLTPGVNFLLSGILDHSTGDSTFGIGLTIGQ